MFIPELKNYNGCKGGNGVYQQIISLIPPHKVLVIPFLGHCGIVRNIAPASILIGIDASEKVINSWKKYLIQDLLYVYKDDSCNILIKTENSKGNLSGIIHLYQEDALMFLNKKLRYHISKYKDDTVLYLDPPYPFSTRKSTQKLYQYEFTDEQHVHMLSMITKMIDKKIVISTYDNSLYSNSLKNWNKHSFPVGTRNGRATETIYYNFSINDGLLHDYRYLGKNFKDRERIKLKVNRWTNNLKKLDARERMAIIRSIIHENKD